MKAGDFHIVTPTGDMLTGCFIDGRAALYDNDQKLIAIGPADLDFIETFGKVRAAGHIRARLILERGMSSPDPYGGLS